MARQTQPLFMECTYDDLTFYKKAGKYFVRTKSSLTRQRVKTAPEFKNTRQHNQLLVTASKIASNIYSQLPIKWRQFWMYQAFTGEAMDHLKQGQSIKQTQTTLYNTYITYWIKWQLKTGISLQTGKTPYKKATRSYKTRLKHFTENTRNKRANNTNGRWKQNRTAQLKSKQHTQPSHTKKTKPRHKKMRGKMLQTLRRALTEYAHPPYFSKKHKGKSYINDYCLDQTTFARSP